MNMPLSGLSRGWNGKNLLTWGSFCSPSGKNFCGRICSGSRDGGPIAELDVPERFRWLTAVRSTIIQTSRPHPGFLTDPDATFDKLFDEFVM